MWPSTTGRTQTSAPVLGCAPRRGRPRRTRRPTRRSAAGHWRSAARPRPSSRRRSRRSSPSTHVAGLLVERDELRVERREDHQVVAIQRGAAVDHVAAGHDAVGQAVLVLPQLLAGLGVERERREYEAVTYITPSWMSGCDSWPRCFSPPKENDHTGARRPMPGGIDLLERRVALALLADAPGDDVARVFASSSIILSVTADWALIVPSASATKRSVA